MAVIMIVVVHLIECPLGMLDAGAKTLMSVEIFVFCARFQVVEFERSPWPKLLMKHRSRR